jgi:hypothetical protein
MQENETSKKRNRKPLLIVAAVFGFSLITAGVYAGTQITINGNSQVNLGAGTATFTLCSSNATISATQTYDSNTAVFQTTTFSITGLGTQCANKVLSLAFKTNNGINQATWSIPAGNTTSYQYQFGYGSNGSNASNIYQAQSAMSAFDTAAQTNLSTVAIAVQ